MDVITEASALALYSVFFLNLYLLLNNSNHTKNIIGIPDPRVFQFGLIDAYDQHIWVSARVAILSSPGINYATRWIAQFKSPGRNSSVTRKT